MNLLQDRNFKLKYQKCKYRVKLWESDFKKNNGHNPTKDDIKEAPEKVRNAYKSYYLMKTKMLEELDILICEDEIVSNAQPIETEVESISCAEKDKICDETDKLEGQRVALADIINCPDSTDLGNIISKKPNVSEVIVEPKLESDVWGPHLNVVKDTDEKKSSGIQRSLSSSFAEKLSKTAQFTKRNPRKSLSSRSSKGSKPSIYNTLSQDSLSETFSCSSIEFSQDNSAIDGGVLSCSLPVQNNESDRDSSKNAPFCLMSDFQTVKYVSEKKVVQSQPVNFIQKAVSLNNLEVPNRNVNEGWLNRCTKIVQVDKLSCINDNAVDEPWESNSNLIIKDHQRGPLDVSKSTCDDIGSDEEVIFSSDDESQSMFSLKRKSSVLMSNSESDISNVHKKHKMDNDLSDESLGRKYNLCSKQNIGFSLSIIESVSKSGIDVIPNKGLSSTSGVSSETNSDLHMIKSKTDDSTNSDQKLTNTNNTYEELSQTHIEDLANQIIENKASIKTRSKQTNKKLSKREILEKKLATGEANENFQRINLKKKVYVRGKKKMTYAKHKKLQWKANKRSASLADDTNCGGGVLKCFKCGDVGHYAKYCKNEPGDSLMPENEDDDSPFPTLEEAASMALACSVPSSQSFKPPSSDEICSVNVDGEYLSNVTIPDEVRKILLEGDEKKRIQPIYLPQEDGQAMAPTKEVYNVLKEFGHAEFRAGQAEAIMRILSGLSTLVTLSTGSGKSLCYQLPALMYSRKSKCLTLVVSPLVSLMEDQVMGLPKALKIACLHHNQSEAQRQDIMERAKSGELDALLVSPESVMSGERGKGFGSIMRDLPPIAFACIDEAHCLSQWSYNFRPSYLMISEVLRKRLGVKTFLGLTATATLSTCNSIINHLNIPNDGKGVIKDTPLPKNLILTASRDRKRDEALLALLGEPRFANCDSIIVYCIRRIECERLAVLIRTCLKEGRRKEENKIRCRVSTNAEPYHAGLSAARRKLIQKNFMSGKLRIVVATVAFGMGIDKQNIRAVIHYNMPRNFESYVQEVGRAGRDGLPAQCHMFLDPNGGDLNEHRRHIYANSVERHIIRKLLQRVFVPCRCNRLKKLAESTYSDSSNTDSTGKSSPIKCSGHEVAFNISETVQALDLPEENIATMLCYLQLHPKSWIKVLTTTYTMCKVLSYRGPKALKAAAQQSAPLAMAIALEQRQGISHEKSNKIEFPVIDVAAALNWDSGVVKSHLKKLEWNNLAGRWKRTGISVELYERGFRVQAPGMLTPDELDEALDVLHERVESQERLCLLQLQCAFDAFTSVAYSSYEECCENVDESRSETLKGKIREYFQQESMNADLKLKECLSSEDQVISDVRQLVCSYPETTFTGRSVARIFHGIESPCFPAQIWGRCRFWRSHLEEDFKLLMKVASREILCLR